ncbi:hypothetical protein K501DRAFT_336199 [Backusella circina FSU 941]|nr:hypothetical protein K501DRAFT_336199 [Backusella circina FSU 941]
MEDPFFSDLSMTNVSLLEDERTTPFSEINASIHDKESMTNEEEDGLMEQLIEEEEEEEEVVEREGELTERATNLTLKQQEKTIDILKKDNFGLKLKVYFLEKRLEDISPDNMDNILKENVDLKVNIQTLTQELKKYKKMLLELNSAMEMLQNQPCPLVHGMSQDEKEELAIVRASAAKYRDENDRLSKMMADMSAENLRIRSTFVRPDSSDEYNYQQRKMNNYKQQHSPTSSNKHHQTDSQILKSILSDRDHLMVKNEHYSKINIELQESFSRERRYCESLANELHSKKKEYDGIVRSLQDTKQQLRNKIIECDQLRDRLDANHYDEKDDLLDTLQQLKDENDVLYADHQKKVAELEQELDDREQEHQQESVKLEQELQDREQEVVALEAEVLKLVQHHEEKEQEEQELLQEISDLKEILQEKEDQISQYEIKLSHAYNKDEDGQQIAELEAQFIQVDILMKQKEDKIRKLTKAYEAEKVKADKAEEQMELKMKEIAVSLGDRDVRIATLQGDFEAQSDAMSRERSILQEDIKEFKEKYHALAKQMKEKELNIGELKSLLNNQLSENYEVQNENSQIKKLQSNRILKQEDAWNEKVHEMENRVNLLETKLKEANDRLKRDRRAANEALNEHINIQRTLKHKLASSNERNGLLSQLLEQYQQSSESRRGGKSDKMTQALTRLNQELRKELEDREKDFDKEKQKYDELEDEYVKISEELKEVQKQLQRRDNMLTHSISTCDTLKEHKEFMENILYEQATGGNHSFREKMNSIS